MPRYLIPLCRALSHLACLFVLYTCFRILFLVFNHNQFPELSVPETFSLLLYGWRFDVSAIISVNCLYLFVMLLPWGNLHRKGKKLLQVLFIVTNILALLFEAADWVYFPYNRKRSTAEVLDMISRKGDFLNLLPGFMISYWYIFLLATGLCVAVGLLYRFIDRRFDYSETNTSSRFFPQRLLVFIGATGLAFIGQRGGLQLVPINLRNAVQITQSEYVPIVLNTPFSIINSVTSQRLEALAFMPESAAAHIVRPVKQYKDRPFSRKNVVVIVLESFSKEFTRLGGVRSYTPFLDSLMDKGMTFTNAYANGLHSSEGIPAILAGIPSLMEEPFTTSVYGTNRITSIAALLKEEGYTTSFYHGAANGSMSFDIFARTAGIDRYFGRTEYGKDEDYDGSWGIYDEPFLQYFAKGLRRQQQPFMSTVFTLTSHPPYPIPAQYRDYFPKGKLPILECIGYTDHALKKFFEAVRGEDWYRNTLFVITADHCSPMAASDYYAAGPGRYMIPVIFFAPGDTSLKGYNSTLFQQIDILPSVMHYLGYDKPFFALGNSYIDSTARRFVANELSAVYEWLGGGYYFRISNNRVKELYRFPEDSAREYNQAEAIAHLPDAQKAYRYWQALLQVYTDAMLHNRMHAAKYVQAN